jgi:predicted small secreted protein
MAGAFDGTAFIAGSRRNVHLDDLEPPVITSGIQREEDQMKRSILIAVISTLLACSFAGCKAAHHAGNDSMRALGGTIGMMHAPLQRADGPATARV